MFIQTQPTPNPLSLMFVPGRPVMEVGCASRRSCALALLAPRQLAQHTASLCLLYTLHADYAASNTSTSSDHMLSARRARRWRHASSAEAHPQCWGAPPMLMHLPLPITNAPPPNRPQSGSFEFSSARAAMVSPLAKRLFAIDGITGERAAAHSLLGGSAQRARAAAHCLQAPCLAATPSRLAPSAPSHQLQPATFKPTRRHLLRQRLCHGHQDRRRDLGGAQAPRVCRDHGPLHRGGPPLH